MPYEHLSSASDAHLAPYARVRDADLAAWPDAPAGLFMAESRAVIAAAVEAGARPRSFLVSESWADDAAPLARHELMHHLDHTWGGTDLSHDPLFRRASRTSQGTVLQVPWTRIGAQRQWAAEGIPLLHAAGFKVAALALEDRSLALGDPRLAECERLAMVLGTEGAGLFPSTIVACDYTVKIPMAHGVDSLNVAAASAVAFWELRPR